MNIVYTLNDKFVPQVAAGICSVCENNIDFDEINFYLISDGISEENKLKLIDFAKKYNRKVIIRELGNIKKYIDFEFDTTGWNQIVLARLVLEKILPEEVEKVLYLDGDTIVRRNLHKLWETDLTRCVIAASIEPTIDRKRKNSLGLAEKPYYNAGVLLINLKMWRKEKIGKKILDYYKENSGKLFANDQDAINGSIYDSIETISPAYNFYNIFYTYSYSFLNKLMKPTKYIDRNVFLDAVANPAIVHYLGEERPWRIGNRHKYRDDYIKYLNKTPWAGYGMETGWKLYFFCWYTFNFMIKPFPALRYKIINSLIPVFIKYRAKKKS